MSSINLVARAVVLAGIVGVLALPNAAQAQSVTPERALLNQIPATAWATTTAVTQGPVIDGERALLNRFQTITVTPVGSVDAVITESASVDGAKALLNRSSS